MREKTIIVLDTNWEKIPSIENTMDQWHNLIKSRSAKDLYRTYTESKSDEIIIICNLRWLRDIAYRLTLDQISTLQNLFLLSCKAHQDDWISLCDMTWATPIEFSELEYIPIPDPLKSMISYAQTN